MMLNFCLFLVLAIFTASKETAAVGKESWGYVEVRPGANMFWWLYYSGSSLKEYTSLPLVIWLQGGPGDSSTGIGNFCEIGPIDINQKKRQKTWLQKANLLFIDSPVGSGYSYVKNTSLLCTNNKEMALDLVVILANFLKKLTEFQKVPLYIISESYGGKMAAEFALELDKAIKSGKLKSSFKGVILGGPWISPIELSINWGPYLYANGYLDSNELKMVKDSANLIEDAVARGNFTIAVDRWQSTQNLIKKITGGISMLNIQYPIQKENKSSEKNSNAQEIDFKKLDKLMNGPIRKELTNIPKNVTWGGQKAQVMKALQSELMRSATDIVESLLNTTSVKVAIYTGTYDLITNSLGTNAWVEDLNWPGRTGYYKSKRTNIYEGKVLTLYKKKYKNLITYSVLKSGHMVPIDTPDASLKLLEDIFA